MILFLRRSAEWLATAEYTIMMGAVWLGPMPIPVFRLSGNDACRTSILILLWAATLLLTLLTLAVGPLPGPQGVARWLQALV